MFLHLLFGLILYWVAFLVVIVLGVKFLMRLSCSGYCVSNDIFLKIYRFILKSVWTDALSIVSVFRVHLFSKNSAVLLFFKYIYTPTNLLLIYMFLVSPKRVILKCIAYAACYCAHQYSFLLGMDHQHRLDIPLSWLDGC